MARRPGLCWSVVVADRGRRLEMAGARLYRFWAELTEALRGGRPQNEAKQGQDPFEATYADPQRLYDFAQAMTGSALGPAMAIARAFPFERY